MRLIKELQENKRAIKRKKPEWKIDIIGMPNNGENTCSNTISLYLGYYIIDIKGYDGLKDYNFYKQLEDIFNNK